MAITTFAELKSAISSWLDRDDLSDHIESFIALAEARFAREIRIREMQERADLAIAEDAQYIDLPADFLQLRSFRLKVPTTESGRSFYPDFIQIAPDEMAQRSIKDSRRPCFFCVWESQIELDAPADQAYTGEIFYWTTITALSDAQTTNSILTRAPDAYLFASLAESAPFLLNDERIQVWETKYALARDALNKSELASRYSGPLTVRMPGRVF